MRAENRPRILDAMDNLSVRRDRGEDLYAILQDVAEEFEVPLSALKDRAETRWGRPLATDKVRNRAYFDFKSRADAMAKAARERANDLWFDMIPRGGTPNWYMSVESWINRSNIDDPALVEIAWGEFLREIKRLDTLYPPGHRPPPR